MASKKLTEKERKELDGELNTLYNNYVLSILNAEKIDIMKYDFVDALENKLKELSMDLHQWTEQITKDKLDANGRITDAKAEMIYLYAESSRKHIEQLLYLMEKYKK